MGKTNVNRGAKTIIIVVYVPPGSAGLRFQGYVKLLEEADYVLKRAGGNHRIPVLLL
jgi:hypothetical protein